MQWLPITLGIMICGLFWLVSIGFKSKFQTYFSNPPALLFLAYYLWLVIGRLYSAEPDEASKDLLSKFPFFAWSLMLGSLLIFSKIDKEKLLKVFVISVVVSMLYCFGEAVYRYAGDSDVHHFYFSNLVTYEMIPPHYLGLYINFAYGILFHRLLSGRVTFGNKAADIVLLLFLFLSIVLISVRMQYLVFGIVNFYLIFLFTRRSRGAVFAWISSLLVMALLFGLAWSFSGSRSRIKDTYNEIVSFNRMINNKQTNHRKFLWVHGWEVIEDNFWIGTGTGAANGHLHRELLDVEAKFWDGQHNYYLRDKMYNFHNAYLQHWASGGVIGFAIFTMMFVIPLFRRNPLRVQSNLFLIVCGLSFLTESMLERQAGVLFFSFIYSILFILPNGAENEEDRYNTK